MWRSGTPWTKLHRQDMVRLRRCLGSWWSLQAPFDTSTGGEEDSWQKRRKAQIAVFFFKNSEFVASFSKVFVFYKVLVNFFVSPWFSNRKHKNHWDGARPRVLAAANYSFQGNVLRGLTQGQNLAKNAAGITIHQLQTHQSRVTQKMEVCEMCIFRMASCLSCSSKLVSLECWHASVDLKTGSIDVVILMQCSLLIWTRRAPLLRFSLQNRLLFVGTAQPAADPRGLQALCLVPHYLLIWITSGWDGDEVSSFWEGGAIELHIGGLLSKLGSRSVAKCHFLIRCNWLVMVSFTFCTYSLLHPWSSTSSMSILAVRLGVFGGGWGPRLRSRNFNFMVEDASEGGGSFAGFSKGIFSPLNWTTHEKPLKHHWLNRPLLRGWRAHLAQWKPLLRIDHEQSQAWNL